MGTMTGTELMAELRYLLVGRAATDTTITDARILRWINWTYDHISYPNIHRHRENKASYDIALVTDTPNYTLLPATVGYQIVAIKSAVHHEVTGTPALGDTKNRLNIDSTEAFENRTITTGKPSRYVVDGDDLLLDPIPSSTYNGQKLRLRVYRLPTHLTDSATTTVVRSIWDEVILQGAKWRAERDIGYREKAELTKQDFAAILNEYKEAEDIDAEEEIDWMPGVRTGPAFMGLT